MFGGPVAVATQEVSDKINNKPVKAVNPKR